MKNTLIIGIFLLIQCYAFGQPKQICLPKKASSVEKLIPNNWKILATANGDLNGDGIIDIAFVIENTDPKNIELNEGGLGRDAVNLNPRILGIYFKNKRKKLVKALQANEFIILQDSPTMDEPLDGLRILESGELEIDFKFWYSAGSWGMSNHSYRFRFRNERFELINFESSEIHRGTGETTDCSIDFLTQTMKTVETTTDDNNERIFNEESKKFVLHGLKSLQDLKKPLEWKFNGVQI